MPPSAPTHYTILLQGQLPSYRADWFEGMQVRCDAAGNTLLSGPVTDQSALFGLLERIRDLGLVLLAVQQADAPPGC